MRTGKVQSNGIELYYEDWGNKEDPAVLLVCGMAVQLIHWPDEMCQHLVDQGFRVIRFDNREAGLSDRSTVKKMPPVMSSFIRYKLGLSVNADYDLHTLVKDAVGLLNALDIPEAHWVGFSMGGMISQLAAAHHPEKVASLTSIMSSTNDRDLPSPKLLTLINLFLPPFGNTDEHIADAIVRVHWNIRSQDFPTAKEELKKNAFKVMSRSRRPFAGPMHQMAILATGGFSKDLHKVNAKSLIIHGSVDPLVRLEGGKRSAQSIRNAELLVIPGMGHDFPKQLLPRLNSEISSHLKKQSRSNALDLNSSQESPQKAALA